MVVGVMISNNDRKKQTRERKTELKEKSERQRIGKGESERWWGVLRVYI